MSYDGFEIDMLSLGDADCLLVTHWAADLPTRVLIDGGNKGAAADVRRFLRGRSIDYLDHVVCTHPHDDHAAGLVELLTDVTIDVGKLWMHRPSDHVDMLLVEYALNQTHGLKRAKVINETLATVQSIEALCSVRGIPTKEPFAGDQIGPLTVVGPTQQYYTELVAQFADAEAIRATEHLVSGLDTQNLAEALLKSHGTPVSQALQANPITEPENNSSVILATVQTNGLYLFTGDAGAQALSIASTNYELAGCYWMQVPHHGSRRNITESIIAHFSPTLAYVSAKGNVKHPRRAVVNAFKKAGARVYSTHYPNGGHLWHHRGNVPDRPTYSSATALWESAA